jgi:hypothetical protein
MNRRNFLQVVGSAAAASAISGGQASAAPTTTAAQAPWKPVPRFGDGRDWIFEKRFGLFVHWGLYAINAWHEQDQWRHRIPRAEYVKLR